MAKWFHPFFLIPFFLIACRPAQIISDPGPDECQDAIHVLVWADLNGDGLRGSDEPPLPDVLVMVSSLEDPAASNLQLTTGQNGEVHFPARELTDCTPAGYQVVFPRQVPGYQFPAAPVVDLTDFDPDTDTVEFGLIPESGGAAPSAEFTGCDLFSEDQVVGVIGPLVSPPERFASVGEGVGSFDGCNYISESYFVLIQYGPSPGISPQEYFDRLSSEADQESLESIPGFGKEAVWMPETEISGTFAILLPDLTFTVYVNGASPLEIAKQIALLALEQAPLTDK